MTKDTKYLIQARKETEKLCKNKKGSIQKDKKRYIQQYDEKSELYHCFNTTAEDREYRRKRRQSEEAIR